MDILSFLKAPLEIVNFINNPGGAIIGLVSGLVSAILFIPIMNFIFKKMDDLILAIDDKIIDKIPFPPAKKFLQDKLIKRLEKRVCRYNDIIKRVAD